MTNKKQVKAGGDIVGGARIELEEKTEKSVLSNENFKLPERKIKKLK